MGILQMLADRGWNSGLRLQKGLRLPLVHAKSKTPSPRLCEIAFIDARRKAFRDQFFAGSIAGFAVKGRRQNGTLTIYKARVAP